MGRRVGRVGLLRARLRLPDAALGRRLVTQTAGNLGLNGATFAFNFIIALLLSRLLGPEGFGAYAFAVAWAMLLAVPALLGLPSLVVREIAAQRVRADWGLIRGLIRRANQSVLAASLLVSLTVGGTFALLGWPDPPLFKPTLVGLALVPLVAVISIRQAAMQGFGAVVRGRVPEALVAPLVTIAFILVLEASFATGISASDAVGAYVLAAALTALLGGYLLRRTLPRVVRGAVSRYDTRVWLLAARPIFLTSGIEAVSLQAGTILTGALAGSEEAGIFSVAMRISAFLPFLFLAAVPPMMPAISELYERGELDRLQRLVTRGARAVFLISLPLTAFVLVFAEPILALLGEDFRVGATALRILCLGQFVNIATGFVRMILIMVGEAGATTRAAAAGTTLGLVLSAVLVPALGADGAAIATATSLAFTNLLMVYLLWQRRRIYSPALRLRRSPSW
jgi:O-antigen/teichoic acid export membrane protein